MDQNEKTVSIVGTYSDMDEIGSTIHTIALTWDRLEHFKNILPRASEKMCGHGDSFLYLVVIYNNWKFLLQCIVTARFDDPKNIKEALLSQEALDQLGIDPQELPVQIYFEEMKMCCKDGAETERFIINLVQRKEKEEQGTTTQSSALEEHLQAQLDEIISKDPDTE